MPRARPVNVNASDLNEENVLLTIGEGPLLFSSKIRYEDAQRLSDQLIMILAARRARSG
jgi:hypothetical protein